MKLLLSLFSIPALTLLNGGQVLTNPQFFDMGSVSYFRASPDKGIQEETVTDDTARLVSHQFSFTEGPAVDKQGNIFFTDQPNNRIWEYDTSGQLSLFLQNSGRSNGMYFDKEGNLLSCADGHNEIWSISSDKEIKSLLNNFHGGTFNGPNDIWVNPLNDAIFFTDPYYKRDYWTIPHPHMSKERVYYWNRNTRNPVVVESDLKKPNGIIGTPDGKFLYIADIGGNRTYRYEIRPSGRLSHKQLFVKQGSDGMTIDNKGDIYLTGNGVTIYNKEGKLIQHIAIHEPWTANVCIGGKQNNILFITASQSIYTLRLKVKGVQ